MSENVYDGWTNDQSYMKVCAVVDMFFTMFKEHKWAGIRLATIRSRYKDCAALISLGYIVRVLGMESESEYLEWVFTDRQAAE